jgi:hypothetical protein
MIVPLFMIKCYLVMKGFERGTLYSNGTYRNTFANSVYGPKIWKLLPYNIPKLRQHTPIKEIVKNTLFSSLHVKCITWFTI